MNTFITSTPLDVTRFCITCHHSLLHQPLFVVVLMSALFWRLNITLEQLLQNYLSVTRTVQTSVQEQALCL